MSELDESLLEGFKTAIRSIPSQVRGKVVSSRNYRLPLSNGKNLNVINIPIVLVYNNSDLPLNVYPHFMGTSYIDVEQFMDRLLEEGPQNISVLEVYSKIP